jgi:multidrug efflux system outer membrane protein
MRALLLALPLLAACATERPPLGPRAAVPPGFAVPAGGAGVGLRAMAADPALAPLLEAARAGSPDLEAAAQRVLAARAALDGARAARRPSLDGSAGVARRRASLDQLGFEVPPEAFDASQTILSPTLSASWEADLFGRLRAARDGAAARRDAAVADAAGVSLLVETEVARALLAIRAADAGAEAAKRALDARRKLLSIARIRAEAGLVTALDAETIAGDVAAGEAALAALSGDRAAAIAALIPLTGLPRDAVEALVTPARPLPAALEVPAIPSDLLARRPDVAAAWSRLAAADRDAAEAMAARYPRLTLSASLGLLLTPAGPLELGNALAGSLGAAIAGPILDFGRTQAAIAAADARAGEAAARYRLTVLTAFGEVEEALGQAEAARARAVALEAGVRRLARARALAEAQYRGGLVSGTDLAEADRRLADAQQLLIAADRDALDALLRLECAVGGAVPGVEGRAG